MRNIFDPTDDFFKYRQPVYSINEIRKLINICNEGLFSDPAERKFYLDHIKPLLEATVEFRERTNNTPTFFKQRKEAGDDYLNDVLLSISDIVKTKKDQLPKLGVSPNAAILDSAIKYTICCVEKAMKDIEKETIAKLYHERREYGVIRNE